MAVWTKIAARALVTGSVASVTSTIALGLAARGEGRGAFQPVNATSHWLNGEGAASVEALDVTHTAVGYATHHAATVFWAVLFEAWLGAKPSRNVAGLLAKATAMSAFAAAVDYGATPKRFTPGWEFVLSKRAMAVAYAAMALGLVAGAKVTSAKSLNRLVEPRGIEPLTS